MSEQENIQVIRDLYAAFGRGDLQTILSQCGESISWGTETTASEVPWYGLTTGKEGVAAFFATLMRDMEITRFEQTAYAATGNIVFADIEIEYTIKKNGRAITQFEVHRFEVTDKIVRAFRTYEDTAKIRDAWK